MFLTSHEGIKNFCREKLHECTLLLNGITSLFMVARNHTEQGNIFKNQLITDLWKTKTLNAEYGRKKSEQTTIDLRFAMTHDIDRFNGKNLTQ